MKNAVIFTASLLFASPAYAIEKFICVGTEPFWSAQLTDDQVHFSQFDEPLIFDPVEYSSAGVAQMAYVTSFKAASKSEKQSLTGFITDQTAMLIADKQGYPTSSDFSAYCSDGMSDLLYPYTINFFINGQTYTGCCSSESKPALTLRQ